MYVLFAAAQTCALLSTFVCNEKSKKMPNLEEQLSGPFKQMQKMARRIAKVGNAVKERDRPKSGDKG